MLVHSCDAVQLPTVPEGTEKPARNDLALQLHQYCFYPRALLTPADAVYVPRLIRLLHDIGTPGFSTVFAYLHVSLALYYEKED